MGPGDIPKLFTGERERCPTDWFVRAKWGVFLHFLGSQDQTARQWSQQVDGVEVDGLADQLESMGAGYLMFTIGQNSGHFCSPNATYDSIVGIKPGKCSQRDLVADLAHALEPRGIALMVYLPCGAPDADSKATEAFEWHNNPDPDYVYIPPHLDNPETPWGSRNERLAAFQVKWQRVIGEWSNRWGTLVRGWWFDGCYFANAMYRHHDEPNFASFAAAARAGNSDSLLAFNPGVLTPVNTVTEHEDYTAGEIAEALPAVSGRWVHGTQLHILSYLGPYWKASPPRFPDELVLAYTRYVNSHQGVITWDAPPEDNGLIPEPFFRQLAVLKDV